jgi:hypothetical protein
MPTRRIVETVIMVDVLMRPLIGVGRLWAHKTLGTTQPGSFLHGLAEVVVMMT